MMRDASKWTMWTMPGLVGLRLAAALVAIAAGTGVLLGSTPPAVAGGGCRGHSATEADGNAVSMTDEFCCFPTVLHARPGEVVTWTNAGIAPHSVAAATLAWGNYNELRQGGSVSYTFDTAGTYPYYCFVHPGMTGAIVVGDGRGAATSQLQPVRAVQVSAALESTPAATAAVAPATVATVDEGNSPWLYAGMGALAGLAVAGLGFGLSPARGSRGQ